LPVQVQAYDLKLHNALVLGSTTIGVHLYQSQAQS